jgi:carbamoyltransferase
MTKTGKCGLKQAVLGISAYYHDSAAAILVDGQIVAAAQEERFTRKKHDSSFPINACRYVNSSACWRPIMHLRRAAW